MAKSEKKAVDRTSAAQRRSGPSPIIAVFGDDAHMRREAVRETLQQAARAAGIEADVTRFDGNEAGLADVLDACRTPTLMSPVSLIYVQDADALVSANRDALQRYVEDPCPSGVLVLELKKKLASNTRLYKALAKLDGIVECKAPRGPALAAWLATKARDGFGCSIDRAAAARLIELVGDDLGRLSAELSKLATYITPRKAISIRDIDDAVGATRVEKVFGVTDAVARRDLPTALNLWGQVIAGDRDAPYRAVGGLAYGFRRLAEAKRLVQQGMHVAQAGRIMGIWADPASLERQLGTFTLREWQSHLTRLLRIDVGAKTGAGTVESAVERFIVELCEPRGAVGRRP